MSKPPAERGSVSAFLEATKKHPLVEGVPNRLIFAMDATASREPTWDMAMNLHAELFNTASSTDLSIQLVYYRGFNQFHASNWSNTASALLSQMQQVRCLGGATQITRLLSHIQKEAHEIKLKAAVFIGDACEEKPDEIFAISGQLGLLRVPVIVLQEGRDGYANQVFSGIALRSGGAHIPFSTGSVSELAQLLGAVATFATQGVSALKKLEGRAARQLLTQIK